MVSETYRVDVCDETGDKYRLGFNTQEKVNEIADIGNHNTAEFWEYDTRLGRRWNLDPVDQISISNYAVFANNPILLSDILGDEVKGDEKGMKAFNEYKKHISTNITELENELNGITNKTSKRYKKKESELNKWKEVEREYKELEESTNQMYWIIGESELVNTDKNNGGLIKFNKDNGYVEIHLWSSVNWKESLPHELKHAFQFHKGDIYFLFSTGSPQLSGIYDIYDEIEAFERGQLFGIFPDILLTPIGINNAFPNKYDKLPREKLGLNSIKIKDKNETYLDIMKKRNKSNKKNKKDPTFIYINWKKDYENE